MRYSILLALNLFLVSCASFQHSKLEPRRFSKIESDVCLRLQVIYRENGEDRIISGGLLGKAAYNYFHRDGTFRSVSMVTDLKQCQSDQLIVDLNFLSWPNRNIGVAESVWFGSYLLSLGVIPFWGTRYISLEAKYTLPGDSMIVSISLKNSYTAVFSILMLPLDLIPVPYNSLLFQPDEMILEDMLDRLFFEINSKIVKPDQRL